MMNWIDLSCLLLTLVGMSYTFSPGCCCGGAACGPGCPDDDAPPTDVYVDLTGWPAVAGLCANCAMLAQVYTLTPAGGCQWGGQFEICRNHEDGVPNVCLHINLLRLGSEAVGIYDWRVLITVVDIGCGFLRPSGFAVNVTANYREFSCAAVAENPDRSCDLTTPRTLTKCSQSVFWDGACSGNPPNTITIEAA